MKGSGSFIRIRVKSRTFRPIEDNAPRNLIFYTRSVARFSGTHSKSMILQMGEVLIYESNRYCEKNRRPWSCGDSERDEKDNADS